MARSRLSTSQVARGVFWVGHPCSKPMSLLAFVKISVLLLLLLLLFIIIIIIIVVFIIKILIIVFPSCK